MRTATFMFICGLLYTSSAAAYCPKDKDLIKFRGVFDATHCKYSEVMSFDCFPKITLHKPITDSEGKTIKTIVLHYDRARLYRFIKPLHRKNVPVDVKGCGYLEVVGDELKLNVWNLHLRRY